MQCTVTTPSYPYPKPFVITGYVETHANTIQITLEQDGHKGIGEALGVYYFDETPDRMVAQIESVLPEIEAGLSTEKIQTLLPPGGARNALDCAYWDFLCKAQGRRIWELLGTEVEPVNTVFTLGIASAEEMAESARQAKHLPNLKIKLDSEDPVGKLRAIRRARPDATLVVDVNQGWSFEQMLEYLPQLEDLEIAMLEQPLPRGNDAELEGFSSPIPLGGDESFLHLGEFEAACRRYDVLNIKLDKCGGLTEALQIVERARTAGKRLMVGCMSGTSYSMAPAFIVAQHCEFVDIDGPLLLSQDVPGGLHYADNGRVDPPEASFWG